MTINQQRAKRAKRALDTYSDDDCANLIDLLTDLRHYALAAGIDFNNLDRIAAGHFDSEANE
jgi:hypothetical protein